MVRTVYNKTQSNKILAKRSCGAPSWQLAERATIDNRQWPLETEKENHCVIHTCYIFNYYKNAPNNGYGRSNNGAPPIRCRVRRRPLTILILPHSIFCKSTDFLWSSNTCNTCVLPSVQWHSSSSNWFKYVLCCRWWWQKRVSADGGFCNAFDFVLKNSHFAILCKVTMSKMIRTCYCHGIFYFGAHL